MRAIVAWPVSWTLFWIGHFVSVVNRQEFMGEVSLYPVYNWLMIKSGDVQDWAGLNGPWKP